MMAAVIVPITHQTSHQEEGQERIIKGIIGTHSRRRTTTGIATTATAISVR